MKPTRAKLGTIIAVIVVTTAGFSSLAFMRGKPAATTAAHKAAKTTAKSPSGTITPAPDSKPSNTSSSTKTTADIKKPAENAACKLLTTAIAQQLLGADAKPADAGNVGNLQTSATTVATCTYTSDSGALQLTLRTPKNSLGVSENATVFGSERPSGATTVTGYGQSAFWDPDEHRLNVLGHNTWHIITRTSAGGPSSLDDTKAAANLLTKAF
ncbi:MAG TPA: hypothetical protein VLF40_03520 [Candidatus Saccharimonadales bacterium]|nr:hypothetical protein [Candidatus Saccharimonadales bacterium]